jgi:hypothetical protein
MRSSGDAEQKGLGNWGATSRANLRTGKGRRQVEMPEGRTKATFHAKRVYICPALAGPVAAAIEV